MAAAVGITALVVAGPPQRLSWFAAMLVVGFIAAVGRPQAIGPIQVSASGIVQVAAIPLLGPVGAALVASLPVLVDRNEVVKRVFNVSQRILYVTAGSLAYALSGGQVLAARPEDLDLGALAAQVAVAALTIAVVNSVLLAGVLQITTDGSLRVIVTTLMRQVLASYASYAIAAYVLVILWAPAGMGWASTAFFLPSLFVIQWGLQQYATEWATRHQMLSPFVLALDQRHPGAAEEARLGAGAATAIATSLALKLRDIDEITAAARIRDVGKLALDGAPEAIVRRDHAAATRTVLGSITFLEEPLLLVAAHRERVDGQGGPHGLRGDQIPLGARVVAVADLWARAVSEGSDRAAAVDRCEELAGTALDVACVAALRRALEREQLPAVESS